jgi:hypothetical protein
MVHEAVETPVSNREPAAFRADRDVAMENGHAFLGSMT